MSTETKNFERKKYICAVSGCTSAFSRPYKLECHQRVHVNERPFICAYDDCLKSYTNNSHLKRHEIQVHEPKNTDSFVCNHDDCTSKFSSLHTLKKHEKRMHVKRQYKCKVCPKTFIKNQHLKIHEYEHTGIKPFSCPHEGCGKAFLLPSRLKRHQKLHIGYKCDAENCSETFEKWTLLRRHKKTKHPHGLLFLMRKLISRVDCKYFLLSQNNKSTLLATVYQCSECKKRYYSKNNLKIHGAVHSKEREAFHCPYKSCPRFYYEERNMHQHVKSCHENRTFSCSVEGCSKSYKYKVNLLSHMKSHNPKHTVKSKQKKQRKQHKLNKNVKKKPMASVLSGYPESQVINNTETNSTTVSNEVEENNASHLISEVAFTPTSQQVEEAELNPSDKEFICVVDKNADNLALHETCNDFVVLHNLITKKIVN